MKILLALLTLLIFTGCSTPEPKKRTFRAKAPEVAQITDFTYDASAKSLEVIFKDGSTLKYLSVPSAINDSFEGADDKGVYYRKNIKNNYATASAIMAMGMKFISVASTVYNGANYDAKTQKLRLLEDNGKVSQFNKVPPELYEGFMESSRKAGFVHGFLSGYQSELVVEVAP